MACGWLLPFYYASRLQLDPISPSMSENETAPVGEAPPCPKCGGEMWDNRAGRRNPRAPDFKCKDKSCAGVIWPPRDSASAPPADEGPYEPRQWPAPAGTPDDPACPVCGGKMWDDRANKRNPRAPDFKCRNKPRVMGGPGCLGVIWPPRDGEPRRSTTTPSARPTAQAPKTSAAAPPPPLDPDYPPFDDEDLPF
jgi:hypothetical protein